jgi:hypothetical protein
MNMQMQRRNIPRRPINAPPPASYGAKDYFTYSIVLPATLSAGGTTSGSFNVDKDSDFMWMKGTFYADIGNATQSASSRVIPGVTVVIKDTTSGRDIMTTPVPIPAMFGTGELPFILPTPKLLPAVSTITVSFANITADGDYTYLGLFFHGQKLFG